MKNDSQLQRDVLDQLKWEPGIREAEIGVAAKGGVVTLSGSVDSYAEKYLAIHTVERVSGVKAAVDDMHVKLPMHAERTDTDLAHAAVDAMRWHVQVPDDRIKLTVRDGWLTLEGDVEWQYQKEAAERALRNLVGLKGMTNLVTVRPKHASAYDVGSRIKESLRRSADVDSTRITVEEHDGRVTLKGTVRSFAERRDAELAAWSAPGVTNVEDQIAINA